MLYPRITSHKGPDGKWVMRYDFQGAKFTERERHQIMQWINRLITAEVARLQNRDMDAEASAHTEDT